MYCFGIAEKADGRTSFYEERIDIQTEFQCSAFASAYVLRHFGIDATGIKLYAKMPHKMKNGYVYLS